MNPDLDTLVTSLYVTIDDLLVDHPEWGRQRMISTHLVPLVC